jgi:CBS domain-containing protein
MLVRQILKSKDGTGSRDSVITITPDRTVAEAAQLLAEKRIGAVVVSSDQETATGIISERDIVRELGRRGTGCLSETVGELMTRDIISCTPEDKADLVLARMTGGRFRHMPVMEDGRMIGLISIGDVVKARLDELSMEQEALKGMIMGY